PYRPGRRHPSYRAGTNAGWAAHATHASTHLGPRSRRGTLGQLGAARTETVFGTLRSGDGGVNNGRTEFPIPAPPRPRRVLQERPGRTRPPGPIRPAATSATHRDRAR